jgi:hypothetical protein
LKNNNPYSKYRYDNNLSVKVRTNETNKIVDVFGASMRPPSDNISTKLYDTPCEPYGATTVVNYVYRVERINQVDKSIVPPSYKGPTFFKLFKL